MWQKRCHREQALSTAKPRPLSSHPTGSWSGSLLFMETSLRRLLLPTSSGTSGVRTQEQQQHTIPLHGVCKALPATQSSHETIYTCWKRNTKWFTPGQEKLYCLCFFVF